MEQAYELWQYPDDWVVEMFAGEGPKLMKRGEYFYLVAAVGGTAGPPNRTHGRRLPVEIHPRTMGAVSL